MSTLESLDFVWRDGEGYYRVSSQLLQIGAIALHRLPPYQLAEPHLWHLADATEETAYLAVLDRDRSRALYLRQVEGPNAIRHASWAERTVQTAGTAVGVALLGKIADHGYATSRNTIEADAAAVYDANGSAVTALSVIGPSFRINDEGMRRLVMWL